MRLLVCGDREWNDYDFIVRMLANVVPGRPTLIHGDCRGADRIAGRAAKTLGWPVETFPADWKRHGKAAGPIRNRQMLDTKPDLVIAFHDTYPESRGTKDCVEEARRRGIETAIYGHCA